MAHTSFAALQQSCAVRLFLTLDTGFVCVPHGYTGNIPCYWYSLGHLWTSYIQRCGDFSNRKCCAQYAEPETPKWAMPTASLQARMMSYGLTYIFRSPHSSMYGTCSDRSPWGLRVAVCFYSDCSPNSHSVIFSQWLRLRLVVKIADRLFLR